MLNAKISSLFARKVQFCRRLIFESGIQYRPRRLEPLLNMKKLEWSVIYSSLFVQQIECEMQSMLTQNGLPRFNFYLKIAVNLPRSVPSGL